MAAMSICAIAGANAMLLAEQTDQAERITQTAGKNELGELASLDAGPDEIHETGHVVLKPVFFQQRLDSAELPWRQDEARDIGLRRVRLRPVEIEIGRFVIAG